ncbi:hypothetical protein RRG08_054137 [Elysia crispata]|uniref:Uncharacterized protein n=1 Tax=Elysia crispata TaxID=231223 RepID=A0AAE0Y7C0_9GAST|nr:hypothetical protein RRG08_054137 [Elysia crispata]
MAKPLAALFGHSSPTREKDRGSEQDVIGKIFQATITDFEGNLGDLKERKSPPNQSIGWVTWVMQTGFYNHIQQPVSYWVTWVIQVFTTTSNSQSVTG